MSVSNLNTATLNNTMQYLHTKNYKDFEVRDITGSIIKGFSGAKNASKALPGDIVEVDEAGCKLIKRNQTTPIAGLLELNSKTKYGFTGKHHPMYLFTPFDESYPVFVVGSSERDTSINRQAIINFENWPAADSFPRGSLIKFLGSDEEALSWTYTPLACMTYKDAFPELPSKGALEWRTKIKAFHIDPAGCRDVDDVLSFDVVDGRMYITITISDVAEHIPAGHPLDARAKQIAQTLYQDGAIPRHMFPANLSEDRLSLLPSGGLKLGLSLKFPIDCIESVTWFESVVETTSTYTYESVYEDKTICESMKAMARSLGEDSEDSHKWIEAAMKFYNIQAAILLRKSQSGVLRSHSEPDKKRLDHMALISPDFQFLAYSSAIYVPASEPDPHHHGLDAPLYTHATSPIRRYADLINQRVIKSIMRGSPVDLLPIELPNHLNTRAKFAKRHDRDLIFVRALRSDKKSVTGCIIELGKTDLVMKIAVYVNEWQQIVKLKYKVVQGQEFTVISKDETVEHKVSLGKTVVLQVYADMTARNWKKRMVLRLK